MKNQKKLISKRFGLTYLSPPLREIFHICMAKESSRYAIKRVYVGKKEFAATDGRRLFVLLMEHQFEQGLFFVTKDGYCLKDEDGGKFPKWGDVLAKAEDLKVVFRKSGLGDGSINELVCDLFRAGNFFNLDLALPVLKCLGKTDCTDVEAKVYKENAGERAFEITGRIIRPNESEAKFIYVQMPVNRS